MLTREQLAAIAALGPAPPAPVPTHERAHHGKVRGVVIWAEPIKHRLRQANAIGGLSAVVAAFPGWQYGAVLNAINRYCGVEDGPPAPPLSPAEFNARLTRIPAATMLDRVAELLTFREGAAT